MYCVSLQQVRQCNPQRGFSRAEGVRFGFYHFLQNKCISVPFFTGAKNLEILGLLALFFCLIFQDNISKEIV